jgi:sigma-B regulation protein RsbU (phosphoserine phosphatase)
VGGDLYDFFPLPGGRLGVAVGDVSGKGVPAALYMMMTRGLLSAGARDTGDLKYLLSQVNLHLYRTCKRKIFVTMAAVALDPAGGLCLYGRAGHNPAIWRRTGRGESVLLKSRGLGLGMVGAEAFMRSLEIRQLELEPGDALVLYSDGVTEAVNASMDQFGEERLLRSVDRTDGRSAAEGRSMILRDVAQFMGATAPRDDITVVFVRVGESTKAGDAARELV